MAATLCAGLKTANCRSPAQTRLPSSASPARPKNAPASLPDRCFRKPRILGPKKPPLEPIALISAIPAAAEGPFRNFVGRHQNGDMNKDVLTGMNAKAVTRSSE